MGDYQRHGPSGCERSIWVAQQRREIVRLLREYDRRNMEAVIERHVRAIDEFLFGPLDEDVSVDLGADHAGKIEAFSVRPEAKGFGPGAHGA